MTLESPTVGSLFSGIGGFDLGLERAGWRVIWQVEHDVFRQSRLKRHWPHVELRGDIRTETDGLAKPDLICGGFPCQDLSISGNRKGLAGERSGLWFEYLRVVQELRPTWVLIENVPGLLSSHKGRDFEVVVSGLTQCGYGVAWRVLDSQYFGVAQRRRRVFVIASLGAPCPPEILFEPEGSGGDPAPGRRKGETYTGSLRASTEGNVVVCPPSNPDGVREAAGVPGRMDTPDGPRYAALGDAVTVPLSYWIGRRILNAWRNES